MLAGILAALAAAIPALALSTISLSATRGALLADGKHSTTLRAEVRDSTGRPGANNQQVQFHTTSGTLSQNQATTVGGVAQVTLTSSPIAGVAHVTASVAGQAIATIDILFSDDPEATFEGNNYVSLAAVNYLAYSATDRIVEGDGHNGGARLAYHNLEITADRLQLRCDDLIVRAHDNITVKRGKSVIHATRLYYNIQSEQGYAIEQDAAGGLKPVTIHGANLRTEALTTQIPYSFISIPDLQVKLVVVSRGINYFPGDRLQFRRARFFQDQVQILSLPYYELGLHSTELFSDQFVSVGTSGLGLDLPYYFNLSAKGSLIGYLHHQQQLGRGYYATEPGWGVDLIKSYSQQGSQRYEGAYGFTNMLRGDWGFRWTHSQEFNNATQGSVYLDFPSHDSVFSSADFTKQFKAIRIGANLSGGQTFLSPITTSNQSNLYAETMPHALLGMHDLSYTLGTTYSSMHTSSRDSTIGNFADTEEGVNIRTFLKPRRLGSRTTLTNSFSVGQSWSSTGASGLTSLVTTSLDQTLYGGGSVNLTYDYVNQPTGFLASDGKHRISGSLNFGGGKRFQASVFASVYLDAPDASVLADLSYKLNSQWRMLTAATMQRFGQQTFQDFEVTLGRRIGARELQLTYSTLNKRFSFDLTATRF